LNIIVDSFNFDALEMLGTLETAANDNNSTGVLSRLMHGRVVAEPGAVATGSHTQFAIDDFADRKDL
jgi:hypothetical protein